MTMLIATHELTFARDVADRVCFLHDGVVHEEGPAAQLLDRPARAPYPRLPPPLPRPLTRCEERQPAGGLALPKVCLGKRHHSRVATREQ